MINFFIDMCYDIVHFYIPKFKIESVKSKWYWKESATDANAVSHGQPTDGSFQNTNFLGNPEYFWMSRNAF